MAVQGHPRSSILVPIESALHCFDIIWLKIAYFSHPSLIRHPRSLCSIWNFAVNMRKLES